MTDQTDALQTILNDADEMIREKLRAAGLLDTPFVLVAVSDDDAIVVRANLEPAELKKLAENLVDAATEVLDRPDGDGQVH